MMTVLPLRAAVSVQRAEWLHGIPVERRRVVRTLITAILAVMIGATQMMPARHIGDPRDTVTYEGQ